MDRKWGFREGKLIKAEKSVKRQGEDYSDIKKKMVTFAATWMDVEMITRLLLHPSLSLVMFSSY